MARALALTLLIEPRAPWSTEGSLLWTVMQGSGPCIGLDSTAQVVNNAEFHRPNNCRVYLFAQESDRGWHITHSIPEDSKGSRSQQVAIEALIPLESLRQQLDEGNGI